MSEQPAEYERAQRPLSTKLGHGLAKILGIKLEDQTPYVLPGLTRGESVYSNHDTYVENDPTVFEYFSQFRISAAGVKRYTLSFFPVLTWAGRYNMKWFTGDMIAGLTVGCVVIPQGSECSKYFQPVGTPLMPAPSGLLETRTFAPGVRPVLVFCRSHDLLVLCYV